MESNVVFYQLLFGRKLYQNRKLKLTHFYNRCISVYFPRRDIYSQRKTAKMTIAFCWIFPIFMLSLPLTNLWGQFGLECGTKNCVILRDKSGKTLQSFLTLVGFFLPLLTLIICNIAIYIRVKVTKYLKMNICLRNPLMLK